jgi:hypothetical protein
MKEVILQPEVAKDPMLKGIVEAVTPILSREIGEEATATWSIHRDDDDFLRLRLVVSDWENRVAAEFTPEELQSADRARSRISRLWRNLLKGAFRQKMQAVEEAVAKEEAGV